MSEIMQLATKMPGSLSPVSYGPPEGMLYEAWEAAGKGIMALQGATRWWLGDWLAFGEAHYGEMYSQALDQTDYAYQTLLNAASVSRRVPVGRRRLGLSWSHHEVVSRFKAEQQAEWLDRAEEEGLSVAELRAAVRPPKAALPQEPVPQEPGTKSGTQEPAPGPETGPPVFAAEQSVPQDLQAWSRVRVGRLWKQDDHLELMAKLAKILQP